jgi:hypothetical protein
VGTAARLPLLAPLVLLLAGLLGLVLMIVLLLLLLLLLLSSSPGLPLSLELSSPGLPLSLGRWGSAGGRKCAAGVVHSDCSER